ncbi:MAG TPA: hypothetical protein VNX68_08505 [Nitrosopumilaceae archaeon]|jgi:hypothetical protein|nr:hypothetical protein [Nitrosopumilaceae archaeon]
MENKNVKYVQGPKFPTPQEMSFADLIRDYVTCIMDSVPGSVNKKMELIAKELNERVKWVPISRDTTPKVEETPPTTEA